MEKRINSISAKDIKFLKASLIDIDVLTQLRMEVLIAANNLQKDVDMSVVREETYHYYEHCFKDDSHVAYLAYDGDKIIGTGAISIYSVMPTYSNPSGKKAYIMNMYTKPEYRRCGIAYEILDYLVIEAKKRHITEITLEATIGGKPLYEKYGFKMMKYEMELAE